MVISQTPLRISLLGGGTDYREYFSENGGAVLGASIDKYVYITVARLSQFFDHTIRVSYAKTELVKSVDQVEHPCVRECLKFMGIRSHIEINHMSDMPAYTGLGSSSSFAVGLLHSLAARDGKMVVQEQLSRDAVHIEREVLSEPGGYQDQYLAACGGFRHLQFTPQGGVNVQYVVMDRDRCEHLQENLVLYYAGLARRGHETLREQAERRQENRPALDRLKETVAEGLEVLTSQTPLHEFGKLLDEAWRIKKSLSSTVSTEAIDDAYATARRAGAVGGKLMGAGGGGFLLLYVERGERRRVREALKGLLEVTFRFEERGTTIIFYQPWTEAGQ